NSIPEFLDTLDIAVLPSLSEGMSNALLEYMAAGKAIVATAVGANTQLIEHGVHGLIVPAGDPQAMASAICQLWENRDLAAELGLQARRRVVAEYSRMAMLRRFEDLYRRLISVGVAS